MTQAIGFIETIGLAAAIEAVDAAVKSANVRLLGYELSKGLGMVTVKVQGDVGAVMASIEAAKAASSKVNRVYSSHVIPRPADAADIVIKTKDTVPCESTGTRVPCYTHDGNADSQADSTADEAERQTGEPAIEAPCGAAIETIPAQIESEAVPDSEKKDKAVTDGAGTEEAAFEARPKTGSKKTSSHRAAKSDGPSATETRGQ
jgi:microcompartment protein CcmL/EutN